MHGDFVAVCFGVIRQIGRDFVVYLYFFFFYQLHHQHGRKLFCDGAQSKFGIGRIGNAPFHVRHSVAFFENYFAIFSHQNAAVKLTIFNVLTH